MHAASSPPPIAGPDLAAAAQAAVAVAAPVQSVNGQTGAVTISSAVLPGTYTVAGLPAAVANKAKYAFVSDLGGGADMVLSDGANWKHIRQGVITDVAGGGTIPLTPLVSPPMIRLTGSGLATASTASISSAGLYSGETFRIVIPSGVLGALGTFGISAGGGVSLPMLGGTWADFQWNGTALVKTAGGQL